MVSEWAGQMNRCWILELLVRPTPRRPVAVHDRDVFDRDMGQALTAQAISQLQSGGVHPTIWQLEGFEMPARADEVLAAVGAKSGQPARCIVGRDAPADRLQHWLTIAAERQFVGFAVGCSIWEEPLRAFHAGTLSTEGVIHAVAGAYGAFVDDISRRIRTIEECSPVTGLSTGYPASIPVDARGTRVCRPLNSAFRTRNG